MVFSDLECVEVSVFEEELDFSDEMDSAVSAI